MKTNRNGLPDTGDAATAARVDVLKADALTPNAVLVKNVLRLVPISISVLFPVDT